MINTKTEKLNKLVIFQDPVCTKRGTEKDLANLRITQFLGCWKNPNFFLQYDLIIGDKPKKNLYNGIAKSRRQKKTA